jgi:type IV pilus assembly protein PilY1
MLFAGAVVSVPGPASAQSDPDVRNIRPTVMLLVDTSGSMERLPGCACATPACNECMPMCTSAPSSDERNRWATIVEAMTGGYNEFSCDRQNRHTSTFSGQYDYGYYIPHFALDTGGGQANDGVLDAYRERAKFGLMTFDGVPTFTDSSDLVFQSVFETRLSDNVAAEGMYSYGEPKAFTFPGCGDPHMIDSGARNENADVGQLISVGSDAVDDFTIINSEIQSALLGVRPFGGTPIAGLLDDYRYWLDNHPDVAALEVAGGPGDPFAGCRNHYAILLTDGLPNGEMREYGCDADGFTCPYDRSSEIAADLCQYSSSTSSCDGDIDGLFVVGFDINDPDAQAVLNDIASMGGTGSALMANDRETLMEQLAFALNQAGPGTTTRTVPAFSQVQLAGTQTQLQFNSGFRIGLTEDEPWTGVLERRRFECNELLEPEAQPIDPNEGDAFHESLNTQSGSPMASIFTACPAGVPRCLLTALPTSAANVDGHIAQGDTTTGSLDSPAAPDGGSDVGPGGAPLGCSGDAPLTDGTLSPAENNVDLVGFASSNGDLTADMLNAADTTERDEIIDWVYGLDGTAREGKRLGDIYHSSPVVVSPPQEDLPDESFNLFRQRPEVANRPTVVYVGTNDGILHAFVANDVSITAGPHASGGALDLEAGTELWGFVPPMLLSKLKSARASHQWMVDGTPVVKDVFLKRLPGQAPSGEIYRTVLVVGLRGGAEGYFALDVTDPLEPKFLWQFTDPSMGLAYGQPALAQVLVQGDALQERGIALLPGGTGVDLTASSSTCGAPVTSGGPPQGCVPTGMGMPDAATGVSTTRNRARCWDERGRALYFVDIATGERLGALDDRVFNAPLTGGVSLFTGDVGTVATRAFVNDQDGVMWRVDMSSTDMSEWVATPFFDVFHDGNAVAGEPAYNPPVVTSDNQQNVVVLQATGDIDALDGVSANKVVSVTEDVTFDADGEVSDLGAIRNWEIPLDPGQQVTGPLELFDGKLFFGTFTTTEDPLDACELGESRIWGVEFLDTMESDDSFPEPALEIPDPLDPGQTTLVHNTDPFVNEIVMGVAVTQRPRCIDQTEVSETDPYVGTRTFSRVDGAGGGTFELVAQTSGGSSASGSVGEVNQTLPAPASFTRAESFAGSVQ